METKLQESYSLYMQNFLPWLLEDMQGEKDQSQRIGSSEVREQTKGRQDKIENNRMK
jgi:hypothetical protein